MPELTRLISALPETMRPWWLAAMRQDALIWQACQDTNQHAPLATLPIERWSPAALALAALGQSPDPAPLHSLDSIEGNHIEVKLRRRAGRAFERHTQPRSHLTPTLQIDLAEAGLLALALRERRRLIGGWEGLRAELSLATLPTWQTPLACLFGIIPDPQALLAMLIGDGTQTTWNSLALHTLLSNPLAPDEQATLLGPLLPAIPLPFVEQLATLRPALARRLAAEKLHAQNLSTNCNAESNRPEAGWLEAIFHYAQISSKLAALASEPQVALNYLMQASQELQHAQAALSAQTARLIQRYGLVDAATTLSHWRQAVELDPTQPAFAAALAHSLLDHGQTIEAAQVLHANINQHDHPDMRFALARLAYESGDHERARHLCIQTLQTLERMDAANLSGKNLADLGMLLLELGRPQLAIQAVDQALLGNPADPSLLALLAQAHFAAQNPVVGMQAMFLATQLSPENISLRRQYAAHLESQGNWAEAWLERIAIIDRIGETADPLPDLYALATCALRAEQPQSASETCQRALALNPEDGSLHALYGEALSRLGNQPAALEHFNAATLLAPGLAAPWLALAQAFRRDGQAHKAIETLRAAAQSAAHSAEIHLALGEAYLAANAPTPALEALRHAAELEPRNERLPLPLAQAFHHLGYLAEARQVIEASGWEKSSANDSIALAYTYAQVLLALGDLTSALPPLRAVVSATPVDASPYLDYACTLMTLRQDIPQAIEALRHVIAIAPHQLTAHAFLAEALVSEGDLQAALQAYQTALESDLAHDTLWRGRLAQGLGETALALEQTDTAIAAFHEASQCNPQNPQLYPLLAKAYQQTGLIQNAQQALRTALRLAPHRMDLRLQLADLHLQQHENELARATLLEFLDLDNVSAGEYQQAAQRLLVSIGDTDHAVACLEKGLAFATESLLCDLLSDLALAHQQAGDPSAGLQSIERAMNVGNVPIETLAELRRVKTHLLIELGKPDEALTWIETALNAQPDDVELHQLAAELLRQRGEWAGALQHANHALCNANQPNLCVLAAELARGLLQFDYANQVLQANPQAHVHADALHAELALENQAEIEAANAFTRAIEHTPFENILDPGLRGRLLCLQARLTLRRGDVASAHELYQQARDSLAGPGQPAGSIGYAFAAAALDLEDWETALTQARQSAAQSPHEPYAVFQLARLLVHRAEAHRLYESVQAVNHAQQTSSSGNSATAPAARREFERAIKRAYGLVGMCTKDGGNTTSEFLVQWEKRGKAVFQEISDDSLTEQPYQTIARLLAQTISEPAAAHVVVKSTNFAVHPAIYHYLKAFTGLHADELTDALEAIQMAQAIWPEEPRWHALAAEIHLEAQNYLQAVENSEQAVQLEPQRAVHHLLLGQALLALREQHVRPEELTRRALHTLEQATRLDPNLADAWYALAHTQLSTDDIRQAAMSAEYAINLAPEQPDYLLLRAQIALHSQEPTTALQHAQAALNLQPERHTALLLAARALQALNRPDDALNLIEHSSVLPSVPTNQMENLEVLPVVDPPTGNLLALHMERLRALARTRGPQSAQEAAVTLAEEFPHQPHVLSALAHLQAENGEREAAIRTAQKALQLCKAAGSNIPTNQTDTHTTALEAELHYLVGDLMRRSGQLDQAVYHFNQAIQFEPQHIEACLGLGQAQQERRQYRQALGAYQQAIATAPHDSRAYLLAGLALKDGKNYLEAETMLRRAAELAPKDVTIRRQLAAVVALNLVHNRRSVGVETIFANE